MIENVKRFFRKQSKNYIILAVRRTYASLFNNISMQYNSLYMKTLGLNELSIGIIRSLGDAASAIVSPILGFLADNISLKKALLVAIIIEMLSPTLYYMAWNWQILTIGAVLGFLSLNIVGLVENLYIANSLRRRSRATGFSIINMTSTIVSFISPMVAAYIVDRFGGITLQGIKPLYLIQAIGLAALSPIVIIFLKDIKPSNGKRVKLKENLKQMFQLIKGRRWLQKFIFLEALGGYVWGVTGPYYMIYAVEYKGADQWIIGSMGTALNVTSLLSTIPIGRLGDKYGRVKILTLFRPTFYISLIIFLLAPNPWFLVLSWTLRGIFFSTVPLWQTLSLELVPEEDRGKWSGVKGLIGSLIRIPSATLGGILWSYFGAQAPFIFALIIDLFVRFPLICTTPETLHKEKYFKIYGEKLKSTN